MATSYNFLSADLFTDHARLFKADVAAVLASDDAFEEGETVVAMENGFAYRVAASAAADHHVTNAGGTKFYCLRPAGGFDLTQWGVVPDDVTSTAAAQAAIDALLETDEAFVRLPAGNFIFSQLRLFNSSGGDRAQRAKFKLIGAGAIALTDAYNGETVGDFYGTRIEIQGDSASDDGILLASNDTKQRFGQLEDLTVIYGGTGYAIDARYIPAIELRHVTVRITSATGKALNLSDCWGGVLDKFNATPDKTITSTVHGVQFAPTLFAGSLKLRECVIDAFDTCLEVAGSANFASLVLENTWLQKFHSYGFHCQGALWNIVLRDLYIETAQAATNHIRVAPSASVRNFDIEGGFFIGGTSSASWVTNPMIHLDNVSQCRLSRIKCFRPWGSFLHLESACALSVDGVDVQHDGSANLPTGPTYMFSAASGFYPKVEIKRATISDTSKLEWCDPDAVALSIMDGDGYHMRGPVSRGLLPVTIGLGSAYSWSTATIRPNAIVVSATAGTAGAVPVAARLIVASSREAGEEYRVFNSEASTQDVLIRNGSSGTNLATVAPGEVATCLADPDNNDWLILVTTFTTG